MDAPDFESRFRTTGMPTRDEIVREKFEAWMDAIRVSTPYTSLHMNDLYLAFAAALGEPRAVKGC